MATMQLAEGVNPLIPNGTFIVELVIFAIVLWVIWKVILPPIQKVLQDRHDMVQKTIDDNREATKRFAAARERHNETLAEARAESGKIRDEARSRGQAVLDEFRQRAQAEADDVRHAGEQQLAAQREQILGELRGRVGDLSSALATRVVGEDVRNPAMVDEYVGGLSRQGGA
jgi:F-type H+-transporting ATPase subunit b